MKKNVGVSYPRDGKWITIRMCLVTVKLISFLLVISLTSIYGKTYSQYVSVDLKQGKLTDLFEAIQEQSEFIFFYKDNLVADKHISISARQENIIKVLDRALRKQGLGYSISGNQITIKTQRLVQQRTIKGKVTGMDGLYMADVNVLIKGSNMGVTTDDEGDYEITITDEVTLIFSMVGYKTVEINTKGQNTIDVILEEESRSIDEVVVVGYNAVERQHIASSITQLDMRTAKSRPIIKLQEAFSGTLPGVIVMQTSNMPGDAPGPIQIRGISTLQNAEPLVIVDGMEQSLSDIDPNQIKSISVLKDAASASMYGSRGANGVIIIETERGETGQFKVDLHAWSALSKPIDLPNFVNAAEYMRLNNEARTFQGQTPVYTAEDISNAEQGLSPNVDWLDVVMERPAMSHNTSANISGGGGVGTFNLMLGYTAENGLNAGEGTDKFSARFNTNINIADKFVLLADFYAHRLQVDRLYANDDGHGLYKRTWWTNPTQAVYYPDSELPDHFMLHNNENPLARIRHGGYQNNMHDRSTINLRPRYNITPNLHIDGNVSYMINKSAEKYKRETFKFFDGDGKPVTTWTNAVGSSQGVSVSQITARATVNYEQNLRQDQDKLYVVAGTETMNNTYTDYREIAKASFFGKVNYAFADRYLVELTARADGSSKFAPGNRWGLFPSGAIAWNLHNESFLSGIVENGIINDLKIRASYGLIGNENVDPYLWQEVVNTWGWTMRVPNLDFSWEKQQQGNLGIDLTMLNNRLNFTGEIYKKHSYDLIYSNFPVPPLTGSYYLESSVNIGEVENKGWELSANWSDQVGNVSYTIGGMLFDNINRVLKAGYNTTDTLIFKDNNDKIWYRGIAIDNYYGYQSNGYFNSTEEVSNTTAKLPNTIPGDIHYVDQNGDGVINDGDKINLGDPFPHLNYSINLSASYKRWDFNLLGQGVGRRTGRLNGMEGYPVLVDGADNNLGTPRVEYAENRWTPDNPNSRFPRVWTGASSNAVLSDVWLSDASFFRIKMLQLGYTFSGVGKSLRNIRIYINAQDAITLTNWEGLEPERDGGDGSYPRMAVYSLGLKATVL